ncbi:MAG: 50S ribosomal protein L32 [Firmicutes bacterium]|nr:50S ribosomal protein L32 [Bacillota bacterium]
MAVPKGKISKARGNSRFANWKLSAPNLVECAQCKTLIPSHIACSECGYYKGKQAVVKKEKESK